MLITDYKRYLSRQQAWEEVGESVGLSTSEVKKRWRSLRDAFIKHVKQNPDESMRGGMLHYEILKFLTPYVTGENARTRTPKTKKTKLESEDITNVIYIQNEDDGSGFIRYKLPTDNDLNNLSEDGGMVEEHISLEVDDQHSDYDCSMTEQKVFAQKRSRTDVPIVLDDAQLEDESENYTIEEKTDQSNFKRSQFDPNLTCIIPNETLDSDEKFLLSLSPALKRLNAKKNFLARIKMQQLLFEIEFDEKYDRYS